jgi:segregation and condensation protein B
VRILEALLFVSSVPLTAERAAEVIRGLTPEQFQECLDDLNRRYRTQGRPYSIQQQDPGHVLGLRPMYRFVLEKLYGGVREARLSAPTVDVLAIVAYRQPISRSEVEILRGHDSGALLRQLVRRGLIGVVGRAEAGGSEVQYGTTPRFLEVFGLSNLEELPETEDLSRM